MDSWRAGCGETRTSGSEGGPGKRTVGDDGAAPRARPYRLANNGSPSPRLTSRELPVTEKEPLLAGLVSGRRFAVAEVDAPSAVKPESTPPLGQDRISPCSV